MCKLLENVIEASDDDKCFWGFLPTVWITVNDALKVQKLTKQLAD
jgi:hypothetical protein